MTFYTFKFKGITLVCQLDECLNFYESGLIYPAICFTIEKGSCI